jgi:tetratricopeptide (TPR) repeat protein
MEQSAKEYAAAHPNDADAQSTLEQTRRDKNEFELKEYQLWAENYPTDMTFKFQAAQRMFALGQFEESIPFFQQAEADAKFRNQARILLGRAFYELAVLRRGHRHPRRAGQGVPEPRRRELEADALLGRPRPRGPRRRRGRDPALQRASSAWNSTSRTSRSGSRLCEPV